MSAEPLALFPSVREPAGGSYQQCRRSNGLRGMGIGGTAGCPSGTSAGGQVLPQVRMAPAALDRPERSIAAPPRQRTAPPQSPSIDRWSQERASTTKRRARPRHLAQRQPASRRTWARGGSTIASATKRSTNGSDKAFSDLRVNRVWTRMPRRLRRTPKLREILTAYMITFGWAIVGSDSMGIGIIITLKLFDLSTRKVD